MKLPAWGIRLCRFHHMHLKKNSARFSCQMIVRDWHSSTWQHGLQLRWERYEQGWRACYNVSLNVKSCLAEMSSENRVKIARVKCLLERSSSSQIETFFFLKSHFKKKIVHCWGLWMNSWLIHICARSKTRLPFYFLSVCSCSVLLPERNQFSLA